MPTIDTYIFVHDQEIVLDSIRDGRFDSLPRVSYVFLGLKPIDKIENRCDVIVARNLNINIENIPKFCSFTGWYALWKNNLIKSDYVNLFEYDISVFPQFNEKINKLICEGNDFIGYVPFPMKWCYINSHYLAGIAESIKKNYGINIKKVINELIAEDGSKMWSSTSNSTFSLSTFNQYMDWFDKLINDLKGRNMCGHAHERSISFFYLLFNKKIHLAEGIIEHSMLNSHKTV